MNEAVEYGHTTMFDGSDVAVTESCTGDLISTSDSSIDEQTSSTSDADNPMANELQLYRPAHELQGTPPDREMFHFFRTHVADYFADIS